MTEAMSMTEWLLLAVTVLLALIWVRLEKVATVTANVGAHVAGLVGSIDDKVNDIQERVSNNLMTEAEEEAE